MPLDGQGDDVGTVLHVGQNPLPLPVLDLRLQGGGRAVRRLLVGHLQNLQLTVTAQPLRVLGDGLLEIFLLDFSNCDQTDFHK